MIKLKLLFYLLLIFFINQLNVHSFDNKILFKIENEIITSLDIENESKYLLALNRNIKNIDKKEIFEISRKSIIREKIKKIEISKNFNNPNISEKFLNELFKNIYLKIGIENLEDFKKYLKINNIEFDNIKSKIKIEALWNELIFLKFASKIKINEEELKNIVLDNNRKISKSYLMSEIFFEISNIKDLNEKFFEIKETIKENGFNNAALKHSLSDTSNIGGKLGWINYNSLNKNLKKIIYNMKINEFTDPIKIPGGFLILKIDKIKEIPNNQDTKIELKKMINLKKNEQLNQFSKIYFNKIKKDIQINEL